MNDNPENVPEGVEVIPVATTPTQKNNSYNDEVDDGQTYNRSINKVRHIESGEKPWWMDSSSNVPDGVVKIPMETSNSTSDSSESFEKIDIGVNPEPEIYAKRNLSRFPIEFPPPPPDEPLGDRASPEGVNWSYIVYYSFNGPLTDDAIDIELDNTLRRKSLTLRALHRWENKVFKLIDPLIKKSSDFRERL